MYRHLKAALALCLAIAAPLSATAQTLQSQVDRAVAAVTPLASLPAARQAGWRPFGGDEPLMGRHYYLPGGIEYIGDAPLDPAQPSNLIFSEIAGQERLVALAYNVWIGPGEGLPEGFIGARDVFHVHDMSEAVAATLESRPLLRALVSGWVEGERARLGGRTRLAMVHLWLVPNPDGVFAAHNRALAYLDLGLPASWAGGGDMDAARGVALAAPEGCAEAVEGRFAVANVSRAQRSRVAGVCGQLSEWVRGGIAEGQATLNARGAAAYQRLEQEIAAVLTPEQSRRIAAMMEHGGMDHGGMGHGGMGHGGMGHGGME